MASIGEGTSRSKPANLIDLAITSHVFMVVHGAENSWLWHSHYGHLNFPALCKLACEEMVQGLPDID